MVETGSGAAGAPPIHPKENNDAAHVLGETGRLALQSFTPLILGLGSVSLFLRVKMRDSFFNWTIICGLLKVFVGLFCFFVGLRWG